MAQSTQHRTWRKVAVAICANPILDPSFAIPVVVQHPNTNHVFQFVCLQSQYLITEKLKRPHHVSDSLPRHAQRVTCTIQLPRPFPSPQQPNISLSPSSPTYHHQFQTPGGVYFKLRTWPMKPDHQSNHHHASCTHALACEKQPTRTESTPLWTPSDAH